MTNSEAIEELKNSIVSYEVQNRNNITCDPTREVLDMAIQALEENEQLKSENCKYESRLANQRINLKNIREAYKNLESEISRLKEKEVAIVKKVEDLTNTNDSGCKDYEEGWYDCLKNIKKILDWSEEE